MPKLKRCKIDELQERADAEQDQRISIEAIAKPFQRGSGAGIPSTVRVLMSPWPRRSRSPEVA